MGSGHHFQRIGKGGLTPIVRRSGEDGFDPLKTELKVVFKYEQMNA